MPNWLTPRRALARSAGVAVLAACAVLAIGCGGTVLDDVKMEGTIKHDLEAHGEKITRVDCPSGVSIDPGSDFECAISASSGHRAKATLRICDDEADVALVSIKPPLPNLIGAGAHCGPASAGAG